MYHKYSCYILPQHYNEPYGIHGISHVHRVLYLADVIAQNYDLTDREKDVLGLACCYHDIGRVHNWEDSLHGEFSSNKVLQLNLLNEFTLNENEKDLVLRLIVFHCLEDELFVGTEREKLIFQILKDADGLDRVRIFDLDPSYLRLEKSRSLVDFAWKLLDFSVETKMDWTKGVDYGEKN